RFGYHFYRPPAPITARYWRMSIQAPEWFQIGRLWAGPAWSPAWNYSYGWSRRWVNGTKPAKSERSLIQYADEGARAREVSLPFEHFTPVDAQIAEDMLFDIGTNGQLLLCLDPLAPGRQTLFATLIDPPPTIQRYCKIYEASYLAVESR
ncbi:hypothetical protein, partial [Telmatospirillum sp. J64-1]|uniref:hypothetical protein n=1 Tax=Telmatospirillum sp. J64-1 TaxID=2502183 RepID=UPI00163DB343